MATDTVLADVAGSVWKIVVAVGDRVDADQELMILESMKMEIPALATRAGVVDRLLVAEGDTVSEGQALVLLDHASGSRRLIDAALARHGAHCTVSQEVGHPTTVFRMVEAGIGISVMPALALPPQELGRLAISALTPTVERDIVLVHRRNRAPSPLAQRVWALVRQTAQARGLNGGG